MLINFAVMRRLCELLFDLEGRVVIKTSQLTAY